MGSPRKGYSNESQKRKGRQARLTATSGSQGYSVDLTGISLAHCLPATGKTYSGVTDLSVKAVAEECYFLSVALRNDFRALLIVVFGVIGTIPHHDFG